MSNARAKAEGFTKQVIGQMIGDDLLVREGKEQERKAKDDAKDGAKDGAKSEDKSGDEDRAEERPRPSEERPASSRKGEGRTG